MASFFKKVLGGEKDSNEVEGKFYDLLKKQGWHCLLNRSTCVIDKLNGRDVLTINRIVEEGEEIEAGDTTSYKYILGSGMEFKECEETPCEKGVAFSFLGTSANSQQTRRFLFELADPQNKNQLKEYNNKLKFLKSFNRGTVAPTIKNVDSSEESSEEILYNLDSTEDDEAVSEEIHNPPLVLLQKKYYTLDFPVKYMEDSKKEAELFIYSPAKRSYKRAGKISVQIASSSRYSFYLCLFKEGNLFFHHSLDCGQHIAFIETDQSIEWIGKDDLHGIWGMKAILSADHFASFRTLYTICEWEMKNSSNFQKLKADDQLFILSSVGGKNTDSSTDDVADDFAFIDDSESEFSEEEEDELEIDLSSDQEEDSEGDVFGDEEKNSGLAVGFVSDRAFVSRGKKIGVFKITENNQLEFSTTIDNITTPGKHDFNAPSQMMLHEQDAKMILLNDEHRNSIFCMDMNRGEIVEEWATSDGYPVKSVVPESQLAQLEQTPTFVGINSSGAFRIDPREKKSTKQKDRFGFLYQRSTNTRFGCASTTVNGDLVMGSENGDVRLFHHSQIDRENRNDMMKAKAKNQLRLAGDPVLGVDVTRNGEWILATCKTYLMVIPVKVDGVDGFERSLTGDKRLPGRRLELSRDHLWEMGGTVSFTVARFNRDFNNDEKTIVTSSGPYVITWDFVQVMKGVLNKYQIKQYTDTVVDEQFKFGEDKAIVVTLPDDVKIAKRAKKQ